MNIRFHLRDLLKEAHKYQYAGISDKPEQIESKKPRLYFTPTQCGLILLAAILATLSNGFSENFAGYIVAGLSLFAGLFFSFILMLFDRFQKIDFEPYKLENNARMTPIGVRLKNYYKKATTLSFYIILLALLCIVLLSLSLLDISVFDFISVREDSMILMLLQTIKKGSALLYRGVTMYFLLDFLWITLYLTATFHNYIFSEYEKVKLK